MREFLFGTRDPKIMVGSHTATVDLSLLDDLNLEGVQLHYAIMEIGAAASRALVPPSLHPTSPGVVSVHFWKVADSVIGSFTLAMIGVIVRTNYKPRHLIMSAFVNTAEAQAALAARCGIPVILADVEQRGYNDAILSTVALDQQTILDVSTHEMQYIQGSAAALKISPLLSVAYIAGAPSLLQAEITYDFKRTRRGKPTIHAFDSVALGLSGVPLGMPALSAYSEVDISLHPLRFSLDLEQPAESRPSTRLRQAA